MAKDIIFVTGFFGAPVKETAEQVAMEKGFDLLSLDDEIERSDGRSILRICMIMGEHEYRNKEYEMLVKLTGAAEAGDSGRGVTTAHIRSPTDHRRRKYDSSATMGKRPNHYRFPSCLHALW